MGFRQTDPLWGGKHLGKSPYTVKTSGCLLTANADSINRHVMPMTPGKLCDYANANHGFQDPKGYLIFDIIRRATNGKVKLVEGVHTGAINFLIEVHWKLRSGIVTTHWLEKLTIPAPPGIVGEFVLDPYDGRGKSLHQSFWVATGRRLSLIY